MTENEKKRLEEEDRIRCVNFLIRMIEKYGPKILAEKGETDDSMDGEK